MCVEQSRKKLSLTDIRQFHDLEIGQKGLAPDYTPTAMEKWMPAVIIDNEYGIKLTKAIEISGDDTLTYYT